MRYWNVGRNHTHKNRNVNHDMERKQYIYIYIYIYIYTFFSLFVCLFFFQTLPKTSQISCTLHGGTILKNWQPRYVLQLMPYLFLAVYSFSCYVLDFLKWNQELLMKLTNRLWIGTVMHPVLTHVNIAVLQCNDIKRNVLLLFVSI